MHKRCFCCGATTWTQATAKLSFCTFQNAASDLQSPQKEFALRDTGFCINAIVAVGFLGQCSDEVGHSKDQAIVESATACPNCFVHSFGRAVTLLRPRTLSENLSDVASDRAGGLWVWQLKRDQLRFSISSHGREPQPWPLSILRNEGRNCHDIALIGRAEHHSLVLA